MAERFPVFLITGQSNADGFAPADELPPDLAVEAPFGDDVLAYVHNGGDGFWAPLSALPIDTPAGKITTNESGPAVLGVDGPRFGPEMSFARAIRAAYPGRRFGICKYASDASSHEPSLNTNFGLQNNWAPVGGVHRAQWQIRVGFASLLLPPIGLYMDTRGHMEHLGESDAMYGEDATKFDAAIDNYPASHRALIKFFRESLRLGGLTRLRHEVPFVQALTSRDWYLEPPDPWQLGVPYSALLNGTTYTRLQGIEALRAAQHAVEHELPEIYSVETEGLGNNGPGDMIHLNGAGQIQHGEDYAAILEPFFDDPTPTFLVSELSVRVPCIVAGRDVTAQGQRCDRLTHATDIYRTILAVESIAPASAVDGVSLVPFFSDAKAAQVRAESYSENFTTASGQNPKGGIASIEDGATNDPDVPWLATWDRAYHEAGYTLIQANVYDATSHARSVTYQLYNHIGGDVLGLEQILVDQDLDFDSVRRDTAHWRGLQRCLSGLAALEPT